MRKIIIIGPAHPYRGGIAKTNEILAEELQKSGYDVQIFTFSLQYPNLLFPGKTQFTEAEAPSNLNIERNISSINPFTWLKTGRKIKRLAPDLVIIRYWLPFMAPAFGTLLRIGRKNKKTKFITLADNIIPHENRFGDKLLTKFFTKKLDGFLTLSKTVLEEINQFNTTKPRRYSPHPIFNTYGSLVSKKEAYEKLNLKSEYNFVLFFGLIRDYKGLDLLIKAFNNPKLKELNVKLLVAGEFYSNSDIYMNLIEELGLESKINIHPQFIPDEEVNLYFSACDLIAQPYKTASQSGVTQVGFHFEKPMLVTNVGGLSEIIPHQKGGYVVEPNPDEIAESIVDFFTNNRKEEFTKTIISEKEKYSWDKLIKVIEELYQEL